MLNQLVEFGKRSRSHDNQANDAIKQEYIECDIVINEQGNCLSVIKYEKIKTLAEAIAAKKGKARLLVDKAEEVLNFDEKKHNLYRDKLKQYRELAVLKPVLAFYDKPENLERAKEIYLANVPEKERKGNLTFRVNDQRLNEAQEVIDAVTEKFNQSQNEKRSTKQCSICGSNQYPITDEPHGMIKKVPDGQSSGSALVSYNTDAYESYQLSGNLNSSICAACARNYVEGLNFLLSAGVTIPKNGKQKEYFQYHHRKKLGNDTALVFWTKSGDEFKLLDYLELADEQSQEIDDLFSDNNSTTTNNIDLGKVIDTVHSGNQKPVQNFNNDRFYSLILSGASARIAVRSWIESSTNEIKQNIAKWFEDLRIMDYKAATKNNEKTYFALGQLANSTAITTTNMQGQKTIDFEDPYIARAGVMLWNAALLNKPLPLSLLNRVLFRISAEQGRVTAPRIALLKIILNRLPLKKGESKMAESCDFKNTNTAYLCGRIFAMLESIQVAALGNDLNAPIRERFFSAASSNPASTFARLLKLSQNHLGKLRGEKPGLEVILNRKLGELISKIVDFPTIFALEDQGRFAIGYYHQRQENFATETKD